MIATALRAVTQALAGDLPATHAEREAYAAAQRAEIDGRKIREQKRAEQISSDASNAAAQAHADLAARLKAHRERLSHGLTDRFLNELGAAMIVWRSEPSRAAVNSIMRIIRAAEDEAQASLAAHVENRYVVLAMAQALVAGSGEKDDAAPHLEASLLELVAHGPHGPPAAVLNASCLVLRAAIKANLPTTESALFALESALLDVAKAGAPASEELKARVAAHTSHLAVDLRQENVDAVNSAQAAARLAEQEEWYRKNPLPPNATRVGVQRATAEGARYDPYTHEL
jgi:hypothetical protein